MVDSAQPSSRPDDGHVRVQALAAARLPGARTLSIKRRATDNARKGRGIVAEERRFAEREVVRRRWGVIREIISEVKGQPVAHAVVDAAAPAAACDVVAAATMHDRSHAPC